MCLESVVFPVVAERLQQDEPTPEASKKPMLPFEALHRVVSPAARANAPDWDIDAPRALFLPPAAFTSESDYTSEEQEYKFSRPRRRTTASVSFCDNAEWVYIDEEDPSCVPVMKYLPLKSEDEHSGDRSPRCAYSEIEGIAAATPKASLATQFAIDSEIDSTPRASQFNSFSFGEEVVAAPPKASLVLPILERRVCDELGGDATPRNNPSLKLDFSFGDGASDEGDGDQGSVASASDNELHQAELDARTPKARPFASQFGMCSDWLGSNSDDNEDTMGASETVSTDCPDSTPRASSGEAPGFHLHRPLVDPFTTNAASNRQEGLFRRSPINSPCAVEAW